MTKRPWKTKQIIYWRGKDVPDTDTAISGALDIIAEEISDSADYRTKIRSLTFKDGNLTSVAKDPEAESVYEMYYNFQAPFQNLQATVFLPLTEAKKKRSSQLN